MSAGRVTPIALPPAAPCQSCDLLIRELEDLRSFRPPWDEGHRQATRILRLLGALRAEATHQHPGQADNKVRSGPQAQGRIGG